MDCRERVPGEQSDSAVTSAAVTRQLFAMLLKRLPAAYRKRPDLPVVALSAHLQYFQMLERELCRNAAEPACVRRARQFIAEHLAEALTADMVAKEVGLCPQQFRKRFKRATGQTFRQSLTIRRLERAKELLATTDRTVLAVLLDAGFQSAPTFYRVFRDRTGQTPTDYREKLR